MTQIISREIQLVSRPTGMRTPANFTLTQTELEPLQDGQVLVRNLYMSVDPYMRGRMNDSKSYIPPFELGKPLDRGAWTDADALADAKDSASTLVNPLGESNRTC